MLTKAEQTTQLILDTVSPNFNKKGYYATSIRGITQATGLTKEAVYGNFNNKKDLALAAFNQDISSVIGKLHAITDFYRSHYNYNINFGRCPILNIGIDANNTNPKLFDHLKYITIKRLNCITEIIEQGIQC